jgi:penicillin amidase
LRRLLKIFGALVIAIVAVGAIGTYISIRRSLPQIDGTIEVSGVSGPVEIIRDADAIPHILASNKLDALFGLGYAHAQDRLWQMEFQRRIGQGRLSEIFGEVTLPQDRFLRTVGFGRAARSAWDRLPADAHRQIEAYVAGVNAFLASNPPLPPEFALLRFTPEPWSGPDVLVWVKMMAWDLSANYSFELLRHDLLARVGAQRTAELLPPYPPDGLSIVGGHDVTPGLGTQFTPLPRTVGPTFPPSLAGHASASLRIGASGGGKLGPTSSWATAFARGLAGHDDVQRMLLGGSKIEALGSNGWVVDGTLTATGKPMLANDPHLGTHVPSLWYLAHVSAGDFDVIGATLPGAPAVAIGRNRFIAWGETNVAADVEDLYREKLDPTGKLAEFRGVLEPLRVIPETIRINGKDPITIDVRISRHGPLVSDAINANNADSRTEPARRPIEPLAFRWTALDDEDNTIAAFLLLNDARNWSDFTAALRHFVVPSQNFVYADVDGHIGYYAPGHIPIRASGDGSAPAEGWSGTMEWTGWIPFDELPHLNDPPEHFIITANHRPMPASYPHLIALEYPDPYRAQRITDLIRGRSRLTAEDFRAIQADTRSLHAKTLLPALLARVKPGTDADRQAVDVLRRWHFDAGADSAGAPLFQAWFLHLADTVTGDELGRLLLDDYRGRFSHITRFITHALASGESAWCDDGSTTKKESCEDALTRALHEGVADLSLRMGPDIGHWRWDAVHRAVFPHQGLDAVAALRPILSRSIPNVGDWSTVNVGTVAADDLFQQRSIPGYRQIVDLSPVNDSRFIDAVGQSGHFMSPHYDDFMTDWRDVRHRKMRMTRKQIENGALGHLRLVPAAPQ